MTEEALSIKMTEICPDWKNTSMKMGGVCCCPKSEHYGRAIALSVCRVCLKKKGIKLPLLNKS